MHSSDGSPLWDAGPTALAEALQVKVALDGIMG